MAPSGTSKLVTGVESKVTAMPGGLRPEAVSVSIRQAADGSEVFAAMGAGNHGRAFIGRTVANDPLARWATAL